VPYSVSARVQSESTGYATDISTAGQAARMIECRLPKARPNQFKPVSPYEMISVPRKHRAGEHPAAPGTTEKGWF